MKRRGLLNGSYWFYMYTTFFAILSLVFFVIENPSSPTVKEILRDAYEGRDTLASLAKRSMAADKCTQTLAVRVGYQKVSLLYMLMREKGLFKQLPEKFEGVRMTQARQLKRQASPADPSEIPRQDQAVQKTPVTKRDIDPKTLSQRRTENHFSKRDSPGSRERNVQEPLSLSQQAISHSLSSYGPASRSYDPYSPAHSTPQNYDSANGTPSSNAWSMPNSTQPLSATLPDYSASIFPSADPLAYPDQPITMFEDQNFANQNGIYSHNLFDPSNNPPATISSQDAIDAQVYGPMPPYLMQGQHSGLMPMSTGAEEENTVAMDQDGGTWGSQGQSYGPVYADGWGQQWMDQGYRQ